MFADAGHGIVHVNKKGVIHANGLKGLGVCTLGQDSTKTQRIILENCDIVAGVSKREKDKVQTINCNFPKPKPQKPRFDVRAEVIYTNRP